MFNIYIFRSFFVLCYTTVNININKIYIIFLCQYTNNNICKANDNSFIFYFVFVYAVCQIFLLSNMSVIITIRSLYNVEK